MDQITQFMKATTKREVHIRAQIASTENKKQRHLLCLEMTNMEVDHVLATACVLDWAQVAGTSRMRKACCMCGSFRMSREVGWKSCTGPGISLCDCNSRQEVAAV